MVPIRFSLTLSIILGLALFAGLVAPVYGQDCANAGPLFQFSDDITPEEVGLKTRLWKVMNLDYDKISMEELKTVVGDARNFLDKLAGSDTGRQLLKSPEAVCLKQQQNKADHFIDLKTRMDQCHRPQGPRELKNRILQAAKSTPADMVECPAPGTPSIGEITRLSNDVFKITDFAMKTAFVNDLLEQSLLNGLATYIDMRVRFSDKNVASAESYVNAFLSNQGDVDARLKKKLVRRAESEIKLLKNSQVSRIGSKNVVNQLKAIVVDMNAKLEEVEKHITVDKGWIKWGLSHRLLAINSDDPVYSEKARAALNAYKEAWRNAVTDPVGMLLLSPSLQSEVGGMRTENDIQEKPAYGETTYSFERHKENALTPEKIGRAIEENLKSITDQSTAMRKLKGENSSLDKKMDRLVRTNPAATGMVLLKNPDYSGVACDSFTRIEEKDESDAFWNKAFLWGGIVVGTVVAVPLILSGVGIVAIGAAGTIALTGVGLGAGAIETAYYINEASGRKAEQRQIQGALVSGGADRYGVDEMKQAYDDYNAAFWSATFAGVGTVLDGAVMFSAIRNGIRMNKISTAFGVSAKNLEKDGVLLKNFSRNFNEATKSFTKSPTAMGKISAFRKAMGESKNTDRLLGFLLTVEKNKIPSVAALLEKADVSTLKALASFSDEEISGLTRFINLLDDEALAKFLSRINKVGDSAIPKVTLLRVIKETKASSAGIIDSEDTLKLMDELTSLLHPQKRVLSAQKTFKEMNDNFKALSAAEKNQQTLARSIKEMEAAIEKKSTEKLVRNLDEARQKLRVSQLDVEAKTLKARISSLDDKIVGMQENIRKNTLEMKNMTSAEASDYAELIKIENSEIRNIEKQRALLASGLKTTETNKAVSEIENEIADILKERSVLRQKFLDETSQMKLSAAKGKLDAVYNPKKYVEEIKGLKLETRSKKTLAALKKNSDELTKARGRLVSASGVETEKVPAALPRAASVPKPLTNADKIERAQNIIIGDLKKNHAATLKKIEVVDNDLKTAISTRKTAYRNITANKILAEEEPLLKGHLQGEIKIWRKALALSKKIKAEKHWLEMKSAMEEAEIALTRIEKAVLANPSDTALLDALAKARRTYKESVAMEHLFRKEAAKLGVKEAKNAAYFKAKIALLVAGTSGVAWVVDSEIAHWLSPLPESEYVPPAREDVFGDEDFMTRDEIRTLESLENLTDNIVPAKPESSSETTMINEEPLVKDLGDSYAYTLPEAQQGRRLNYKVVLPEKFDKNLLADLLVAEGFIESKQEVEAYLEKLITPTDDGLEARRLPYPYDYSITTLGEDGAKVGQDLGVPAL